MRRIIALSVIAVTVVAALTAAGAASASARGRVFYLSVHARQCLIASTRPSDKTVLVVACSNPAHNLEVYSVGHGGWGHGTPPSPARAYAIAKAICRSAFQLLTGHPVAATSGWFAFWPDPGLETARYGDKIICNLRTWPRFGPLGSGWHVH